jgi:quercetin dioxygenase-like cupin family protein
MRLLLRLLALCPLLAAPALTVKAQPVSVAYSPPSNQVPLTSTFVDWDALAFRKTPVGLYCQIFDEPTPSLEKMELHVTVLDPGSVSHPEHHHPWEELLLIKEGHVEVSINGRRQAAGPGFLVFLASHDAHNLANTGDSPAVYYVINFCTGAVHGVRDRAAAEWAPPGTLRSCIVDCDRLSAAPRRIGFHTELVDSPTITFARLESHITTLQPGQGTAPRNRDPGDELFVVKSGEVEATLNGLTHTARAGSLFYVAPNDERTMRNMGKAPCSYQVVKIVSERTPPKG